MATKSFDRSVVLTNEGFKRFSRAMKIWPKTNVNVDNVFRKATKEDNEKLIQSLKSAE